MFCSENCNHKRDAGIIRTDIIRRMMNPLDSYPDLFDRFTTSRMRQFLTVQSDRPPQIKPGAPVVSPKTGWNFG